MTRRPSAAPSSWSATGSGSARRPTPPPSATRAATPSATSSPRATCTSRTCRRSASATCTPTFDGARQPRPDGAFGKMAEQQRGQGHRHRPLGDDRPRHDHARSGSTPKASRRRSSSPSSARIGRKVLGNKAASGTEILKELGEEHLRTGRADPLHVGRQRVPDRGPRGPDPARRALRDLPHRLRDRLPAARRLPRHRASLRRARRAADFKRTPNRRDFPVPPDGETLLDRLAAAGLAGLRRGQDRGHLHAAAGSRAPCTRSPTATASTRP